MFAREVTPNHHKLAEEFVLLDNLYCNGHVSVDGHPWSTMAYNTDYIAKDWALTYSRRAGIDMDDDGDLAKAPSGFLWDACARKGLSYRSYGELGKRVSQPDGSFKMEGRVPGLVGHFNPDFGGPRPDKKKRRDTENVAIFLDEYDRIREGRHPAELHRHEPGRGPHRRHQDRRPHPGRLRGQQRPGPRPAGRRRLASASRGPRRPSSSSRTTPRTAPTTSTPTGPSAWSSAPTRSGGVLDSTQYQTVSMIRTMELILGLPPLSQFDAAATPMFASFTDKADLTPYACEGARINLDAINDAARLRRRAVEPDGLLRIRPDRRLRAERDPLEGRQGPGRPAAPRPSAGLWPSGPNFASKHS